MVWIIVAGILVFLLFLVFISQVRIHFKIARVMNDDEIICDMKALYGLFTYRYEVKNMDFQGFGKGLKLKDGMGQKKTDVQDQATQGEKRITAELVQQFYQKFKDIIVRVQNLQEWGKRLLRHVRVTEVRWYTTAGVGDAVETAILSGVIWGLKSSILGYALRYVRLKKTPKLGVWPVYNKPHFTTELEGQAQIRLGTVILLMFVLLPRIRKKQKSDDAWEGRLSEA
ncbi:DUF2953 domain-containing protein [Paenibacillus gansuensis]|uniref:DUF2953 domain-containing protein n=1 Tax=Paenibacillus gansuensis TaxID=306542 RepID=A0ABW5PAD9_9BACL